MKHTAVRLTVQQGLITFSEYTNLNKDFRNALFVEISAEKKV